MKGALRFLLLVVVVGGALFAGYQRLSPSQQRFVKELVRQAPYLLPRYYV